MTAPGIRGSGETLVPGVQGREIVPATGGAPLGRRIAEFPPVSFFVVSAIFHYLGPAFAVLLFAHVSVLGSPGCGSQVPPSSLPSGASPGVSSRVSAGRSGGSWWRWEPCWPG